MSVKQRRKVIGSVVKPRMDENGKPSGTDYIKIKDDVVLKKGQTLRLESKAMQEASLKSAVANGKISIELGKTIQDRLDKIPEFVRFEIIALEDK